MMLKAILVAILSLAAGTALAGQCTAPQYECASNPGTGHPGWNVCNAQGSWVYGGDCPPKTNCYFNQDSKSPYCI